MVAGAQLGYRSDLYCKETWSVHAPFLLCLVTVPLRWQEHTQCSPTIVVLSNNNTQSTATQSSSATQSFTATRPPLRNHPIFYCYPVPVALPHCHPQRQTIHIGQTHSPEEFCESVIKLPAFCNCWFRSLMQKYLVPLKLPDGHVRLIYGQFSIQKISKKSPCPVRNEIRSAPP